MSDQLRETLLTEARRAAKDAYCPYSGFHVGAAILMDDEIIRGCNVENASYGLTICAERVAIFTGIARGLRALKAVAVTCADAPVESPPEQKMPCGACRQVIAEMATPELIIYVDGAGDFQLKDLLPHAFYLKE